MAMASSFIKTRAARWPTTAGLHAWRLDERPGARVCPPWPACAAGSEDRYAGEYDERRTFEHGVTSGVKKPQTSG
jgi:hypothetical protein